MEIAPKPQARLKKLQGSLLSSHYSVIFFLIQVNANILEKPMSNLELFFLTLSLGWTKLLLIFF